MKLDQWPQIPSQTSHMYSNLIQNYTWKKTTHTTVHHFKILLKLIHHTSMFYPLVQAENNKCFTYGAKHKNIISTTANPLDNMCNFCVYWLTDVACTSKRPCIVYIYNSNATPYKGLAPAVLSNIQVRLLHLTLHSYLCRAFWFSLFAVANVFYFIWPKFLIAMQHYSHT